MIGVGIFIIIFFNFLLSELIRVFGGLDFLAEDEIDRSRGVEHDQLSDGPGQHQIDSHTHTAHAHYGPAVFFAQGQGDFGHRGLRVGIQHFCTMPDDAGPFLGHPGKIAGYVHQID